MFLSGAGLVAVYDSEEESDQDTHQQAGSAEQAKTAAQEINEAEEAAAVVQSYMKVVGQCLPPTTLIVSSRTEEQLACKIRTEWRGPG